MNDLRYALRTLAKSPGFTAVAVLTLALGIGANTAMFTLVNNILMPPPGLERPGELVLVGRTVRGEGFDTFSYPDYVDLREGCRVCTSLAASSTVPFHLSTGGASERIRGALVSGNYFSTLGLRPRLGRFFLPDEDRPGDPRAVAVISHGLWVRRFGARADVVGGTVSLDGQPFTVVGVAAKGFVGTETGGVLDVFVPLATQPLTYARLGRAPHAARDVVWLLLFGRLAPSATLPQAEGQLSGLVRQLVIAYPAIHEGWGVSVAPGVGLDPLTRRRLRAFLGLMLGAVSLVLAIACANVANLLLARASRRRKEMAVRISLGAGRGRLLRQLLTESVLLSLAGAAAGLLVAYWMGGSLLRQALPAETSGGLDLAPDGRVLAFTALLSIATGIAFGLAPAFHASRPDLVPELKDGVGSARSGAARFSGGRPRQALVVTQLAVSLVLLVGAGLLVRTLQKAYAIAPGFATRDVVVASVDLGLQGYDSGRTTRFYDAVLQRLSRPGVTAASLALNVPLGGGGWDTRIVAAGQTVDEAHPGERTDFNVVTPDYFRTMDLPLLRGRVFTTQDVASAPRVVVVNEAIAERLWPGEDPIGKRLLRTWGGEPLEVIGVVKDAKYRSLFEDRRLTFYLPLAQSHQPAMIIHVRAAGDPRAAGQLIQQSVAELDRDLPVYRVQSLAERLDNSLGQQRLGASFVTAFGLIALLLATIGLYAALSYAVTQRTREIGIRIALGARGNDVLRQVLREAMTLTAIGLGLGLAGALVATRVLRSQLYGVTPTDAASFAAVSAVLIAVALVASYVPARRATKVDPMVALRYE